MLRLIGSVTALALLMVACGGGGSSVSGGGSGDSADGTGGGGTLTITSAPPPGGTVGTVYSTPRSGVCHSDYGCPPVHYFLLAASGGSGSYTWSWSAASGSSLPAGLQIVGSKITGTPAVGSTGDHVVVVAVADGAARLTQQYRITIVNPAPPAITVSPGPYGATQNEPYNYQFQITGFAPFSITESGALPPGFSPPTATGLLTGLPTTVTDAYPFTIHVTDAAGQTSSQAFSIRVFAHGFSVTGAMQLAHSGHTATRLANGKVLIAGGQSSGAGVNTAELFDPTTHQFTDAGSMQIGRVWHTATLLCDPAAPTCANPKVLLAGGAISNGTIDSAELYDPTAGTFTPTAGSLVKARSGHTATLLLSGKILIAGGAGDASIVGSVYGATSIASAELYDPATGTFSATAGPMAHARVGHTATLLPDGRVLIAGGADTGLVYLDSAEIYDPVTDTFSTVPSPMIMARVGHTATLLVSGKVLLVGGWGGADNVIAELFDPAAVAPGASFTAAGALVSGRYFHAAVLQPDGSVLIAGGEPLDGCCTPAMALQHAELYDPVTGMFTSTGGMHTGRSSLTATSLGSGDQVLVVGGDDGNQGASVDFNTAEIYR